MPVAVHLVAALAVAGANLNKDLNLVRLDLVAALNRAAAAADLEAASNLLASNHPAAAVAKDLAVVVAAHNREAAAAVASWIIVAFVPMLTAHRLTRPRTVYGITGAARRSGLIPLRIQMNA